MSLGELLEEPPLGEIRVIRAGRLDCVEEAGVALSERVWGPHESEEPDPAAAGTRAGVYVLEGKLIGRSRYQRYFSPKPALAPRELTRLMSVDHWHHEALIAFSSPPRAPIGIARYVRLEEFDVAEVAIEVVDGWQRRGIRTVARR